MKHCNHKILGVYFCFAAGLLFGQDTLMLDEVKVNKKKFKLETRGLYQGDEVLEANVRGYTQLDIFDGSTADFWTSEGRQCIQAELSSSEQSNTLNLEWNQGAENCDWVGMGFGWDGWTAKDLAYVVDTLAIELITRTSKGETNNIPWAFCLEDYAGGQAWLGFQRKFLKAEVIDENWQKVEIPLSLFPFEQFQVDASNIKQLLIQVFGDGQLEIQSIKLIPFNGQTSKSTNALRGSITLDGVLDDWSNLEETTGGHQFGLAYDASNLYFACIVIDDSPRQNNKTGADLWNGDAVEIAFATNPDAQKSRSFLMLSDQHLGVNVGSDPYVWNWKTNELVTEAIFAIRDVEEGYILELAIPKRLFRNFQLNSGDQLDFEWAIDFCSGTDRDKQVRWNSEFETGFHDNPSLWGQMILK